jgi:hypothetical protein
MSLFPAMEKSLQIFPAFSLPVYQSKPPAITEHFFGNGFSKIHLGNI